MKRLSWLLVPALLATPAFAQSVNDTIHKKDGSRVRGVEVLAVTLTNVKYKRDSDELELPAHDLAMIEWHEPPEVFVLAQAAMDRGDFDTATQLFGEAVDKTGRAPLKIESRFLSCQAAVSGSAANPSAAGAAADKLRELLTEQPDHFRVPAMMLQLGRALRFSGNGEEAELKLKELDDRALREAWGPIWSARAKYEVALAQLAQGKAADARNSFRSSSSAANSAAVSATGSDQDELDQIKRNAMVGEGETYVGDKNYPQAIDFFRNLARSARDAVDVQAAAKAGEGQALFLQAVASKRPDDLRKAQLALAEASVLDSAGGDTSAKANYFLGKTLLELGPEKEGEAYKSRAAGYFQLVVKNYSSSAWAALARTELNR